MSASDPITSIPAKTSGIYQIRCLKNGKIYIGSAIDFRRRWGSHQRELVGNKHHSQRLQRAWLKHGADQFVFEILETVTDKANLISAEQEWIDRVRPFDDQVGYNISPTAGSVLGIKRTLETRARVSAAVKKQMADPVFLARHVARLRGRKQPPEAVAKTAVANRGRKRSPHATTKIVAAHTGRKRSSETCARISAGKLGRKLSPEGLARRRTSRKPVSDETRAKMSAAHKNLSEEARANIAASCWGRKQSAETRAKKSAALKGRVFTPEWLAKIAATKAANKIAKEAAQPK